MNAHHELCVSHLMCFLPWTLASWWGWWEFLHMLCHTVLTVHILCTISSSAPNDFGAVTPTMPLNARRYRKIWVTFSRQRSWVHMLVLSIATPQVNELSCYRYLLFSFLICFDFIGYASFDIVFPTHCSAFDWTLIGRVHDIRFRASTALSGQVYRVWRGDG